jgi:phosphate transport system substrate-binding protein
LVSLILGAVVVASCAAPREQQVPTLTGAGATFPYPLYSKWVAVYERETGVRINYQSIGSGGGIRQLMQGTVDFGASDVPMSDDELAVAPRPVLHIPTVAGSVAVVYNLPDLQSGLKLTRSMLVDVFLGRITRWDDPRIVEANPGMALPSVAITTVHRSDGSGTTAVFTEYLASISPEWQQQVGTGTSVNWPVGIGAKGSEGVSGQVQQLSGGLGYVELAYAVQGHLSYAAVQNRTGRFVEPTLESTIGAAAGANLPVDLRGSIVDAPGEQSYPISTLTYLLAYQDQADPVRGRAVADFFRWSLHEGQQHAAELGYAPLPPNVVQAADIRLDSMTFRTR